MGVYIQGMEMPFTCLTCDFLKYAAGAGDFCSLTKRRQFRFKNRPEDCPLIEVPPHGRMIDADALLDDVRKHSESYFADDFAHEWADKAPTIIPAEEVYDKYTDTAGNLHWTGTCSGKHIVKV